MNKAMQEELLCLCSRLIQTRSYSGEEQGVADIILDFMRRSGFDEAFTDKYGNVLGCIRGSRPGKRILFDGHIDTVPAENVSDWSVDPFAATVKDGRIYGRGASDMKGADAAMLYAIAQFGAGYGDAAEGSGRGSDVSTGSRRDFAGEIWFAGVVHEECFEGISARIISERVKPDIVIIGESSEMNIKCSQRGRAEICLETFGTPCHSSNPEKGVNAVYAMMKAVERIRKIEPVRQEGMFGNGILELTDIKSEPYPGASVVPHYCRVTFDRRLLTGETRESVLAPLQQVLDELSAEDESFRALVSFTEGAELCYTGEHIAADRFFPAWRENTDSDYVRAVCEAVRRRGFEPQLTGYSFCTNGSHYGGEAGIPCIGMGPGREDLAHTVDEYIELQDLYDICEYYIAACEALQTTD